MTTRTLEAILEMANEIEIDDRSRDRERELAELVLELDKALCEQQALPDRWSRRFSLIGWLAGHHPDIGRDPALFRRDRQLLTRMPTLPKPHHQARPPCRTFYLCADFRTCSEQPANLSAANFRMAQLHTANLQEAQLDHADLRSASLAGANVQDAYMALANLEDSNLESANLKGAILMAANLEGAQHLDCCRLTAAKNWETAYRDEELACAAPIPLREQ